MPPNDNILTNQGKLKLYDDHVMSIWRDWQTAKDHYNRYLLRAIENWRFYVGVDAAHGFGQWAADAIAYLVSQNRQILTYNICQPIVDRIAGGMMALPIDPDFIPVNSEITTLTQAITQAMYSDKELMDWDGTKLQMAKAGLVFEGVMKHVISDEYHKLGNQGFEYCFPGSVIPEPGWKTWRGKDCNFCFHEQFFQPEQLLEQWPEAEGLIMPYIWQVKSGGHQYGSQMGPTPYANIQDYSWGTALKVISKYEMITEKYKQEYVVTQQSGNVPIPRLLKTPSEKIAWLNANVPDWVPDHVYEEEEKERICVVNRICPMLGYQEKIESRRTEIQTGRLPFFWWSASRDNGEPHSIIDAIKDCQTNINYWESLITNKIQVEGGGGSQFTDRSMFANEIEFDRYRALRNNPQETFELKPGVLASGRLPAMPTQMSQFPREAYEHLNHLIGTMLPHLSKVTPVSKGMMESQVKSGYMYKLMTIQSEQQLYTIHFGWRVMWNEAYEAYLVQASRTYANEGIPRTFSLNKGETTITLNEEVTFPDGRKGIRNDASQLMYIRHKVIISEKQSSPSQRVEELKVLGEYIPSCPQTMPVSQMYLFQRTQDLIDILDDGDKKALKAISDEEINAAMAALKERMLNSQYNAMMLEAKIDEAKRNIELQRQQAMQQQAQGQQQGLLPNQNQDMQSTPELQPQAAGEGLPNNEEPQVLNQGVLAL